MRKPYIAGNWKLWGTRAEAAAYCERLLALLPDSPRRGADVAVCVPFTTLDLCAEKLRGSDVRVCAQTMHQDDSGAFTGEISAPMLTEIGVDGVVLGHSERRTLFGETDRALQEKVPKALAAGLEPILCVGETEEEREAGDTDRKLRHQVQDDLAINRRLKNGALGFEFFAQLRGVGEVAIVGDGDLAPRAIDRQRLCISQVR